MTTAIPKILIIPDPHASPKYDNARFDLLGNTIDKEEPTVVVCLGDIADMNSLSTYDRGKASFEGRRYAHDITAVHDALERIAGGIARVGARRKRLKRAVYAPDLYMLHGNHEYRINRLINDTPELIGRVSTDDLRFREYGWHETPYRQCLALGGVTFSHDFPTGISGRSIGGESMARALCTKNMVSSVCGHSHIFDHHERTNISGGKIFGLSAGCFSHPEQVEDWNINTHHLWWRGVVILENVENGYYGTIRAITMKDMEAKYGG